MFEVVFTRDYSNRSYCISILEKEYFNCKKHWKVADAYNKQSDSRRVCLFFASNEYFKNSIIQHLGMTFGNLLETSACGFPINMLESINEDEDEEKDS